MTKPRLPSRPPPGSKAITKFDPGWICELINCVEYGMDYPRGDGRTILTGANNILRAVASGSGGGSGAASSGFVYNSYFKIIDASETVDDVFIRKIRIADGATGGDNICKVSNIKFIVPAAIIPLAGDEGNIVYVLLKYDAAENELGIILSGTLPNDSVDFSHYQIGRLIFTDTAMTIQQDHITGVAQLFSYKYLCE